MAVSKTIRYRVGDKPAWLSTMLANGYGPGLWAPISGPGANLYGLTPTNTVRQITAGAPQGATTSTTGLNGMVCNWSGGWGRRERGQYGEFGLFGGGHSGYKGNNVPAFDVATRVWYERHANQQPGGNYNTTFGEYPNGSPGVIHTYNMQVAFPPIGPFIKGGLFIPVTAINPGTDGGNTIRYGHILDFNTNTWVRCPQVPVGDVSEAGACYWDPIRQKIIVTFITNNQSDNILAQFDPVTLTYTNYTFPQGAGASTGNGIEQVGGVDPLRDVLVIFNFRPASGKKVWYLKPANLAEYRIAGSTPWDITEVGTPPAKVEGAGVSWSETQQAFMYYPATGAGAVHRFKYESGTPGAQGTTGNLTYRWDLMTAPANTRFPPAHAGSAGPLKIYNRVPCFRYGALELMLTMSNVDEAVWSFMVPPP